ncbi:hypothetical protein [Mesorhizobium sp. 128a]
MPRTNVGALAPASQPQSPAFRQGFPDHLGLLNFDSFDQLGRSRQDKVCRAVDLIKAPHNPKAKTHKSMKLGTPVSNGQRFKTHNSNSKLGGADIKRRSDRLPQRDRHRANLTGFAIVPAATASWLP